MVALAAVVVVGGVGAALALLDDRASDGAGADDRVALPAQPIARGARGSDAAPPPAGCDRALDWCTTLDRVVTSVAAAARDHVAVALTNGVTLLDARTGEPRWEAPAVRTLGGPVLTVPGPDGGLEGGVVVAQGSFLGVEAFAAEDGEPLWEVAGQDRLAVVGATLVGIERLDGRKVVAARDARTRELRWQARVPTSRSRLGVADERSVVLVGGDLVVSLDAVTGDQQWVTNQPSAGIPDAAALSDDLLVVLDGPFGQLHAYDRETGEPRWQAPIDTLPSGVAARGDEILVATGDGGRVLDAAAGEATAVVQIDGLGRPTVTVDDAGVAVWQTEATTVVTPPDGPARELRRAPGERLAVVGDQVMSLYGRQLRAGRLEARIAASERAIVIDRLKTPRASGPQGDVGPP